MGQRQDAEGEKHFNPCVPPQGMGISNENTNRSICFISCTNPGKKRKCGHYRSSLDIFLVTCFINSAFSLKDVFISSSSFE